MAEGRPKGSAEWFHRALGRAREWFQGQHRAEEKSRPWNMAIFDIPFTNIRHFSSRMQNHME
jgi:hypothetical protein